MVPGRAEDNVLNAKRLGLGSLVLVVVVDVGVPAVISKLAKRFLPACLGKRSDRASWVYHGAKQRFNDDCRYWVLHDA